MLRLYILVSFLALEYLRPGKLTAFQTQHGLLSDMLLPTHLLSSHRGRFSHFQWSSKSTSDFWSMQVSLRLRTPLPY